MQNRPTITISAIVLAAGALLSGCTPTTPVRTSAPHAATNIPGLPAGVGQATSLPTNIPNDAAVRANVHLADCTKTGTGWKAAGTITNPSKKPVSRTITIFFTTDKATVISTGQTTVSVDAGKKQPWSIAPAFTAAPKTLCVIRGAG